MQAWDLTWNECFELYEHAGRMVARQRALLISCGVFISTSLAISCWSTAALMSVPCQRGLACACMGLGMPTNLLADASPLQRKWAFTILIIATALAPSLLAAASAAGPGLSIGLIGYRHPQRALGEVQEQVGLIMLAAFVAALMQSAFLAVSLDLGLERNFVAAGGTLGSIAAFIGALAIGLDIQFALDRRSQRALLLYQMAKESKIRYVPETVC